MKSLITLPAVCFSLILFCLVKATPTHAKGFPVETSLGGIEIATTVDSAIAQQLLTGVGDTLSAQEMDGLAHTLSCDSMTQLPSREILRGLSRQYSPDSAMALLIRCLLENPQVDRAQQLFLRELGQVRQATGDQASFLTSRAADYIVVFVPGWGYKENSKETGSDLLVPRQIIAEQGFETLLVPLESNGSVEGSANILAETLRPILKGDKNVILVSASSGGPIVAQTLMIAGIGNHPRLRGWLNICGVLHGSPVIDKLLYWPASWILRTIALFEGWKYQNLISLSRTQGMHRMQNFQPPQQLVIINYIGTPFSGQISDFGKLFYHLLKKQGPNDGLTFITEALAPGFTVLGIGSDHFVMEDPLLEQKTKAFMPSMLKLIEQ